MYEVRLIWCAMRVVLGILCGHDRSGPGQATHAPYAAQALFLRRLIAAPIERTHHSVCYDTSYLRIPYLGGDVPASTGVCTDEVIRSYKAVRIDLQKEVHEGMVRNFDAYPNRGRWIYTWLDPNIDHRRVPNLMVFFTRKGETLPFTNRERITRRATL